MQWDDPAIVDDDRIDHESPLVRYCAERQHANESMHRHDHTGKVCPYCALAASRILRWAGDREAVWNAMLVGGPVDDHDLARSAVDVLQELLATMGLPDPRGRQTTLLDVYGQALQQVLAAVLAHQQFTHLMAPPSEG